MTHESSEWPFEYRDARVLGLRQVDRMNAVAKGTAFRAFKRARVGMTEDRDFFVVEIDAPPDAASAQLIERMHAADALYPGSRVAVLVTAEAYARMQDVVRPPDP